jgi:hypothetical protein
MGIINSGYIMGYLTTIIMMVIMGYLTTINYDSYMNFDSFDVSK